MEWGCEGEMEGCGVLGGPAGSRLRRVDGVAVHYSGVRGGELGLGGRGSPADAKGSFSGSCGRSSAGGLGTAPIQEVLGWRNSDPIARRGYCLVVRMEMDFEKLMNISEVVGRSSDAAILPIGLEGLAVQGEQAKETYLDAGLTGGKVRVYVKELEEEDRWLIWVHPR